MKHCRDREVVKKKITVDVNGKKIACIANAIILCGDTVDDVVYEITDQHNITLGDKFAANYKIKRNLHEIFVANKEFEVNI